MSVNNSKAILCLPGPQLSFQAINLAFQLALAFNCDIIFGNIIEDGNDGRFRGNHVDRFGLNFATSSAGQPARNSLLDIPYRHRSFSLDTCMDRLSKSNLMNKDLRLIRDSNDLPYGNGKSNCHSIVPQLKQLKKILKSFQKKQVLQSTFSIRIIEKHGEFMEQIQKLMNDCDLIVLANEPGVPASMRLVSNNISTGKLVIVPPGKSMINSLDTLEEKLNESKGIYKILFADEYKNGKVQASFIRDLISNFVEPINYFRKHKENDFQHQGSSLSPRSKPIVITFLHITEEPEHKLAAIRENFARDIKNAVGTYRHIKFAVVHERKEKYSTSIVKSVKEHDPDLLVMVRRFRGTIEKFYWEVRSSTTENILQPEYSGKNKIPSVLIYRV